MGIRHWSVIVGTEEFERQMATIKAAAEKKFPGQIIEIVDPGYPDRQEGVALWSILVGPNRDDCHIAHELTDGTIDFEQID